MSLFSSIRLAANALQADQVALQVVGQNISNANTPGYIREEVLLTPAPCQKAGKVLLGMGVQVEAVVQKIDIFLEERLRGAVSERSSAETQEDVYTQLESLVGELGDTDTSTMLTEFFSSVSEILNSPENVSVRNLAVLQGEQLTQNINNLATRVLDIRNSLNDQVIDMADDINRLVDEIRVLNVRIAETEGGNISGSDAVGLRDQRLQALQDLAGLVNIRVEEQLSGGVVVYCGSSYLVYEGMSRPVEVVMDSENGLSKADIQLAETGLLLSPQSGDLRGLLDARDQILGGFLDGLDQFAETLAFEFNKVYSSGQGLQGYTSLTGTYAAGDVDAVLDQAGLTFTPANGSFQVLILDEATGLTKTTDVHVRLTGQPADTTLESLVADLDAIDGLSAELTSNGTVKLTSSSGQEFAFAADTSGVLAALGLNTFFSGSTALDLGVNSMVAARPATFAASRGGIGEDTENAVLLADFADTPLESLGGVSLAVIYEQFIGQTTQASSTAQSLAEAARVFEDTLSGQKMALSGVSLDEEAVQMIAYQRAFQAAARYISTLTELFDILVEI